MILLSVFYRVGYMKWIGLSTASTWNRCPTNQAFAPDHTKEWQTEVQEVGDNGESKDIWHCKKKRFKRKDKMRGKQRIYTKRRIRMLVLRCNSITIYLVLL